MTMRKLPIFSCVTLSAFLFISTPKVVFADWEASVTSTSSKGEFSKFTGKFFSKLDHFRLDTESPMDMSVFVQSNSKKVYAGIHTFKVKLSTKADRFSGQLPACLSKNFEACVKELKLKKVGSEKCEAHTCDIFEGVPKVSGMKKMKLWHWAGEAEPIFYQSILTKKDGSEIRTVFTGIVKKTHPDSFYEIPKGYKDAGSIEDFFGDLQGKSP
jgi:hypothetical protein